MGRDWDVDKGMYMSFRVYCTHGYAGMGSVHPHLYPHPPPYQIKPIGYLGIGSFFLLRVQTTSFLPLHKPTRREAFEFDTLRTSNLAWMSSLIFFSSVPLFNNFLGFFIIRNYNNFIR